MYPQDFLNKIEKQQNRITYVKIELLDNKEKVIDTIEGQSIKGNLSIDGNSSLRRTCQLTLVTSKVDIKNYLWVLHSKFKLQIGLQNMIDPHYPGIIWFPQGIYIITSFSSTLDQKSYTINISGKDKMCLLNGEIGGAFNSQIDFGQLDITDDKGNHSKIKIPIKKIIREMVHQYGNEPFHNILINDLDEDGLELLEYRLQDNPLFLWREKNSSEYNQGEINKNKIVYYKDKNNEIIQTTIGDSDNIKYESLNNLYASDFTPIYFENPEESDSALSYAVVRIDYGDAPGYRETPLTYAGDLIAQPKETITSVLDKIIKMLGVYEYYYNVYGQFVFQKQHRYDNDLYYNKICYTFEGDHLISSFNDTPDLKNAKNDYTVWGERKTASGAVIPIHMRMAIQKKPISYKSLDVYDEELTVYNKNYGLNIKGQQSQFYSTEDYDWREIIYQMALDYNKYNHLDDFELRIENNNPQYIDGKTGYEPYYVDIQGFWRQLYCPSMLKNSTFLSNSKIENPIIYDWFYNDRELKAQDFTRHGERTVSFHAREDGKEFIISQRFTNIIQGKKYLLTGSISSLTPVTISSRDEKTSLKIETTENEWQSFSLEFNGKISSTDFFDFISFKSAGEFWLSDLQLINCDFYEANNENKYWNKEFIDHPENFNFGLEFIDTDGVLDQYSVEAIGNRPKIDNNKSIKSISYRKVPRVIFRNKNNSEGRPGYNYLNTAQFEYAFTISSRGRGADEQLKSLVNRYSYCLESINIKTVPIYTLKPNSIISINDTTTGINGEYIINKISIPLNFNGMMSISGTKNIHDIFGEGGI